MADSIPVPWICKYLIEVGEEYGANIASIPPERKKKRTQLVEFLTYQKNNEDYVWAKISDKEYTIPARFSKAAMVHYNRIHKYDSVRGMRLTEQRNALALVKDFRPFLARIPLGHDRGITPDAWLALEVDWFEIVGSEQEAQWGNPKVVETIKNVLDWTQGLREDGGGGNVLKVRKQERELGLEPSVARLFGGPKHPHEQILPRSETPQKVTGKTRSSPNIVQNAVQSNIANVRNSVRPSSVREMIRNHERSWRLLYSDPRRRKPPPDVRDTLMDINQLENESVTLDQPEHQARALAQESPTPPSPPSESRRHYTQNPRLESSQPPPEAQGVDIPPAVPSTPRNPPTGPTPAATTPNASEWSPTTRGSPNSSPGSSQDSASSRYHCDSDDDNEGEDAFFGREQVGELEPSFAEAQFEVVAPSNNVLPHYNRRISPQSPSTDTSTTYVTAAIPAQGLKKWTATSTLPSTTAMTKFTHLKETTLLSDTVAAAQGRRVPFPPLPASLDSSAPSIGLILVPNSDTSGTASQPHSQSQTLSYSQSQSQSVQSSLTRRSRTRLIQASPGTGHALEDKHRAQSPHEVSHVDAPWEKLGTSPMTGASGLAGDHVLGEQGDSQEDGVAEGQVEETKTDDSQPQTQIQVRQDEEDREDSTDWQQDVEDELDNDDARTASFLAGLTISKYPSSLPIEVDQVIHTTSELLEGPSQSQASRQKGPSSHAQGLAHASPSAVTIGAHTGMSLAQLRSPVVVMEDSTRAMPRRTSRSRSVQNMRTVSATSPIHPLRDHSIVSALTVSSNPRRRRPEASSLPVLDHDVDSWKEPSFISNSKEKVQDEVQLAEAGRPPLLSDVPEPKEKVKLSHSKIPTATDAPASAISMTCVEPLPGKNGTSDSSQGHMTLMRRYEEIRTKKRTFAVVEDAESTHVHLSLRTRSEGEPVRKRQKAFSSTAHLRDDHHETGATAVPNPQERPESALSESQTGKPPIAGRNIGVWDAPEDSTSPRKDEDVREGHPGTEQLDEVPKRGMGFRVNLRSLYRSSDRPFESWESITAGLLRVGRVKARLYSQP